MLEKSSLLDLQSQDISVENGLFTIAPPDIFTNCIAGDVFILMASFSITSEIESNQSATLTLINDYYTNHFGSASEIVIRPHNDNSCFYTVFSPLEFTVINDGVSPLDKNVLHLKLEFSSTPVDKIHVNSKCLWSKGSKILS